MTPIISLGWLRIGSEQLTPSALPETHTGLLFEGVGKPGGLREIAPGGGLSNRFGIGGLYPSP